MAIFRVALFVVLLTQASTALAQGSPSSQPDAPKVSGQLSLNPLYTSGDAPAYGLQPKALDFTSNSTLRVEYRAARATLLLAKPTTYARLGQPDRFYTAELLVKGQALRYGDVTPRFTDNTTGYARVHGTELQLTLGRFAQLQGVHGLSQRAAPTEGYLVGTYRRSFAGARLALSPLRALTLGASVVRMKDDPASADLSGSTYAPRAADNLLVGSDLTLTLFRRRASLQLEYAASVYTDDLAASDSLGRLRRDHLAPRALAESGLVRDLVTFNDSTRVGYVMAAKLVLPILTSRTTLEHRRSSRLFTTLASPWAQSGQDRYRVQHVLPLFDRAVQVMANVDVTRTLPSPPRGFGVTQPYTTEVVNAYANVTLNETPLGRVTVGLRGSRRTNDAPAPEPRTADRRIHATMLAPSLALTRDVTVRRLPLTASATLSGTFYSDAIRPTSEYRMLGLQLSGQTKPEARLLLHVQARLSHTTRAVTSVQRVSADVLLREGYYVVPERVQLFVVQGLASEKSSDGYQHANLWTVGAGGRWAPAEATSLELEWLSRTMHNYVYPDYGYGQHTVELRLTHRW